MARPTLGGKLLHPSKYIAAEELRDGNGKPRDVTLTIESIKIEQLETEDGESEAKPIMRFAGITKIMVLNKTNAETIAELYGDIAENWVGKRITLYPTKVRAFGEMKACVRIRDVPPPPPPPAPTTPETTGATE